MEFLARGHASGSKQKKEARGAPTENARTDSRKVQYTSQC